MKIECLDEIKTGWMTWEEIQPYKEQLIDLELELMIQYHYPDWDIPRSYPELKVCELEQHIKNGNTFFWGAVSRGMLMGYYWAYTAPFINKKRWCLRSVIFRKECQGMGLGGMAIREGLQKAKSIGCDEAVTEYVPVNTNAARVYEKAGYEISRIEVVKKLEDKEMSEEKTKEKKVLGGGNSKNDC